MLMRSMILAACSFLTAAAPAADEFAEAAPITVITYNVRFANPGDGPDVWPGRVDAVAGVIARGDIIGLQEVTHGQLVDLQQRLDGFEYCGVARDDG